LCWSEGCLQSTAHRHKFYFSHFFDILAETPKITLASLIRIGLRIGLRLVGELWWAVVGSWGLMVDCHNSKPQQKAMADNKASAL